MSVLVRYVTSTIGSKKLMALSGLVWSGFVLGHMAGNLLIFLGPEAYNNYGHSIVSNKLVYVAEAGLVTFLVLHIIYGVWLTVRNRIARGSRYAVSINGEKQSTVASRTMIAHGVVLFVFIVLHLITFKFGPHYDVTYNGVQMRDLFRLMVEVFQSPAYVTWYIFSLLLLGTHLSHGVSSSLQSLGLNNAKYGACIKAVGYVYAALVCIGFIAQPVYLFFFYE
jgi:succinate dehydrogenase / fumarate reductase, cytochrome b subunit